MRPTRRCAASFALLALSCLLATPAWAHGSIPGANAFLGGLVHPWLAAAHLAGLVAVGLMATQQGLSPRPHELLGLAVGLLAGVAGASLVGDPDTDRALWLLTLATALGVVLDRRFPVAWRLWMPACIGVAIGLGSGDPGFTGAKRIALLAGSLIGALVLPAQLAVALEAALQRWPHPALRIGLRVLSSWLAACAVLLTALAYRTPG